MNGVQSLSVAMEARGVAFMIKNNLDCTIHHTVIDPVGQYNSKKPI